MRVLVASHDASRTGAPLLLLTFLSWLRRETDAEVRLVLWRGGPLVDAFETVADVTVLHPPPGRRSGAETVELGLQKVGLRRAAGRLTSARVRARLRIGPHDVLYLNGAGSALVLPHLHSDAPAVAHVHELARGLTFSLPAGPEDAFLRRPRLIVAVAQRVADELTGSWGVDAGRVVVVPGCVPDRVLGDSPMAAEVPLGSPLVASVGAGSRRKGVDLFLQVAAGVRRVMGEDVRFAWVGPLDDEAAVHADRHALGLDDVLDLPGEVPDPSAWFGAMSVFASTAREDPFPLVALEAGAAGVPIVAFDSGGIAELLADGRGVVVDPLDVAGMVEAVVAQLADPGPGRTAAARLQDRVAAHHTVEVMAPALWAELQAAARG